MRKISQIKKAIVGSFRCMKYRVIYKKFHNRGIVFMSLGSALQIETTTEVVLGNRVTLEYGSTISGREDSKINIGNQVYINRNCVIVARESISIDDGVTIGPNCCIYDHDHDVYNGGRYITSAVHIKKNTWIGAGCIILKGVTIGEGAVVAAGSIVTKDIPANTLYRNQLTYVFKTI